MAVQEHHVLPYSASQFVGRGRVLVIAPHPDDEVFGCGGAIIRHVDAGDPVRVTIVTDGAFNPAGALPEYALTRREESRHAGTVIGYGAPDYLGLPDRGLEYGELLIQRIQRCVEEHAADLVYAPSWWEVHPDHLAVAMAAAEAVRRSPRPVRLVMYEVGVPLHPNILLDITDIRTRKQMAMACFPSQMATQQYDRHITALNCFRTYTLPATVQSAEAFRAVTREELDTDPLRMIRPGDYYSQARVLASTAPPLVSVIVRSLSGTRLDDALDSIALQTYPHIEIIVVSASGTSQAALPHWRGRFPLCCVDSEIPLSRASAGNLGLDQAQGDFLIVINDEDVIFPDHISALMSALTQNDQARVAYSGVRLDYYRAGASVGASEANRPYHRGRLCARDYIPLTAVLFHRSLLTQGRIHFDEGIASFEDWDFLIQMSLLSDFFYLAQVTSSTRHSTVTALPQRTGGESTYRPAAAVFKKWNAIWTSEHLTDIIQYQNEADESHERDIADLLRQITVADAEVTVHKQSCASLEARVAEQERALLELEHLVTAQAAELTRKDVAASGLQDELFALQKELSGRDAALREAEVLIADLHGVIAALHGARSWRLTRPLRSLVALMRRWRSLVTPRH